MKKPIALIPARSGSTRIPDKNIKDMWGHPLIAYTIRAAIDSGIFRGVIVSTDHPAYRAIAEKYGALPIHRPTDLAGDEAEDIGWVTHAVKYLNLWYNKPEVFMILRPTSPFRSIETIRRAWKVFDDPLISCHSMRAVEKCTEHPYKMWITDDTIMTPYTTEIFATTTEEYHNQPYQSLPELYAQNACLEVTWISTIMKHKSTSGEVVRPFFTRGFEGFDINTPEDWIVAELLVKEGIVKLPEIKELELKI